MQTANFVSQVSIWRADDIRCAGLRCNLGWTRGEGPPGKQQVHLPDIRFSGNHGRELFPLAGRVPLWVDTRNTLRHDPSDVRRESQVTVIIVTTNYYIKLLQLINVNQLIIITKETFNLIWFIYGFLHFTLYIDITIYLQNCWIMCSVYQYYISAIRVQSVRPLQNGLYINFTYGSRCFPPLHRSCTFFSQMHVGAQQSAECPSIAGANRVETVAAWHK